MAVVSTILAKLHV